MNFSSFDYFLALARERSYTRAADVLHITRSRSQRPSQRSSMSSAARSWCGARRWS